MYGTKAKRILRRLQLFPGLAPGLQAPVELTDGDGAQEELMGGSLLGGTLLGCTLGDFDETKAKRGLRKL